MIRTLVAAASPVVRAGLEALLARGASVSIVGVTDVASLVDEIETHEPQVVLLVVESRDGAPAAASLAAPLSLAPDAVSRTPALVLLADAPTAAWTADAVRAGARAVLATDATSEEIVAAVEAAAAGLIAIPAELALDIMGAARPSGAVQHSATEMTPLTRREHEILGMLAEGLANKNIAARLGISEHTVKTHVASILTKLSAYSRAEAVAIGARQGLILL